MSALGHKRTFAQQKVMSALPPESEHSPVNPNLSARSLDAIIDTFDNGETGLEH
jgi:hypothetical protein